VANHPYGAIDGLALMHVLDRTRGDVKVMANFMLQQLEPLKDRFIGVNPFEQLKARSSFQGMRQAMEHLAAGGALGIFPAGEVSSYRTDLKAVADPRWKPQVIKLIKSAQVPVVPIWFDGANSVIFQMLGMIHPDLRTMALPGEMLRMRGKRVRMRIGKPIQPKDLAALGPVEQLTRYLRAKTYALGSRTVPSAAVPAKAQGDHRCRAGAGHPTGTRVHRGPQDRRPRGVRPLPGAERKDTAPPSRDRPPAGDHLPCGG
jgi:putative hemolysin